MLRPDASNEVLRSAMQFTTTHWSVVLAARDESSTHADSALAELCRTYWYPLYAFIRRRGHDATDAQDLTQEFFYRLLEKRYLSAVDRSKGRFRSFLLAAVEHFLANEWRRTQTQKRGGGMAMLSIDDAAERRYLAEPHTDLSPERIYEQRWALAFIDKVLGRLHAEFVAAGKETAFEQLKIFLTGEKCSTTYAELAAQLGSSEAAVKMSVSRMRQRYAELLREEISSTVARPDEVEDELRALLAALA
jgi:RNA polymerase sigma factor (sigma-70 family)